MNKQKALTQQQNEINDHTLYTLLALKEKDPINRKILEKIASEEQSHYTFWKKITGRELKASRIVVNFYLFLASLFGVTFAVKLMESRENDSIEIYKELSQIYPEAKHIYAQEQKHENALAEMLQDKKLQYAGAVVLGMNDALVELTGTLSGIALAFDKSNVVGITGMIMGIAASLSMAGSAYLESKENEESSLSPLVYSLYTGGSYIFTTFALILPFFLFDAVLVSLALMFLIAFLTIVIFNFYIAVAKSQSFVKRTLQMSAITFGVALISFGIGYMVKHYLGIEV